MNKASKNLRGWKRDLEAVQAYKLQELFSYRCGEPTEFCLRDLTIKLSEEGILKEVVEEIQEEERKKNNFIYTENSK